MARESLLPREVVITGPLLETKLHVPKRRRSLVARPSLNERLVFVGPSSIVTPTNPPQLALPARGALPVAADTEHAESARVDTTIPISARITGCLKIVLLCY